MGDVRLIGLMLLAVVPIVVWEAVVEARAGFGSSRFWMLPLEEKAPRITAEKARWLMIARLMIALPIVSAAGFLASAAYLGPSPWLWAGAGAAAVSSSAAVVMFAMQGKAVLAALEHGVTSGFLLALWDGLGDLERSYVVGTGLGAVLVGIGLVTGQTTLGSWVGWSLIGGPGLVSIVAMGTGFFFPQMALLGPILLGVGMVLS
jgi:hypothetical protein